LVAHEPTVISNLIELLPGPGEWAEGEYYFVSDRGRFVELSDGNLEFPPMPTDTHQLILGRLYAALLAFVTHHKLGQIRFAPLPVRLWPGKIREPDLIFMFAAHVDRIEKYWGIPDLAVEIVSGSQTDVDRDRKVKREEYAQAGIAEYWLVDPEEKIVDVLALEGKTYREAARLAENDTLTSPTFPGFELSLKELFAPATL